MPVFEPKDGPLFRWSRLQHFAEAFVVVFICSALWGEDGAAFSAAGVIVAGFGWEALNHWLPGPHMFGDIADWYAFIAGTLPGFLGTLL